MYPNNQSTMTSKIFVIGFILVFFFVDDSGCSAMARVRRGAEEGASTDGSKDSKGVVTNVAASSSQTNNLIAPFEKFVSTQSEQWINAFSNIFGSGVSKIPILASQN